jgi:hypothetical protein
LNGETSLATQTNADLLRMVLRAAAEADRQVSATSGRVRMTSSPALEFGSKRDLWLTGMLGGTSVVEVVAAGVVIAAAPLPRFVGVP